MSTNSTGAVAGSIPGIIFSGNTQPGGGFATSKMISAAEADGEQSDTSSYDPAIALEVEDVDRNGTPTRKRKSLCPDSSTNSENAKRQRLHGGDHGQDALDSGRDRARQLPAEIWHRVFTFLPPKSLGCLLSINKLFHGYLYPSPLTTRPQFPPTDPAPLPFLKPDMIWQASRRLHWPRMPSPLKGKSELAMWRLTCSPSCQFCGKKAPLPVPEDKFQRYGGPGTEGVSPVFPLFIVTCGDCLSHKGIKEIDLYLSTTFPSVLIPALPAAFVSDQNEIVPPYLMQTGNISPQMSVTKIFWPDHLEQVKQELEAAKLLGSAAAEEWLKGLGTRGTEILADASRWEKWVLSGGVHQMRSLTSSLTSPLQQIGNSTIHTARIVTGSDKSAQHVAKPAQPESQDGIHPHFSMELGIPGLSLGTEPNHQPRSSGQQKRTKEEAMELKTSRRKEIVRRALLLNPPLGSDVLSHIPSFQAALQIITPLDDNAWELLRPRLLAQRKDAELRLEQSLANTRVVQDRVGANSPCPEGNTTSTKRVTDADWDEIQGPLRARISDYANEIIRDGWEDGDKVRKKNSPQFAAEVLLYVRRRFYAEVAKDAAAATTAGNQPMVDPPEGPWTQKLTLENMKWVFDFKIKKFTERYRKDLFLCNGCEENHKFYAFEAVVQHYAAKHTGALSVGSIVVHWRAEWPEVPPFKPDPKLPEPASHGQPTSRQPSNTTQPQPGPIGFPQGAVNGYPVAGYEMPMAQYPYGQQPPFAAPNPYAANPFAAAYASHSYPQDAFHHSYPQAPIYNGLNHPNQPSGATTNHHGLVPYGHSLPEDPYQVRLNTLIRIARGTWNKISCVKDLPAPIKICVVIDQITKKFRHDFSEPAPLGMFIDALSHIKEVRPIRNINGLMCQVCVGRRGGEPARKTLSLPQLANHFYRKHIEALTSRGMPPLEWQSKMVLLPQYPGTPELKGLLESNGPAYRLVAETLSWSVDGPSRDSGSWDQYQQSNSQIPYYEEDGQHRNTQSVGSQSSENMDMGRSAGVPPSAGPRHDEKESSQHMEASRPETTQRAQAYSAYDSDVPNLRPASTVYSRKKAHEEAWRCRPQGGPGQETHSGTNQYHSPGVADVERPPRRNHLNEEAASYVHDDRMEFDIVRGRQKPSIAREPQGNLQGSQGPRYLDRDPTSHERGAMTEGWKSDLHRTERQSERSISKSRHAHPVEEFGLLDALESHLERTQQDVIYTDPSGRELLKTANGTFVYRDEPIEEPLLQGKYQRRSPPAGYEPSYIPRVQEPPQRAYHDGPPSEDYELVEVRDPQRSYFIKRPLHRERREYYAQERPGSAREANSRPIYRSVDQMQPSERSRYAPDLQAPAKFSQPPPQESEYEEYDPRYPAGATTGGSAHRYRH